MNIYYIIYNENNPVKTRNFVRNLLSKEKEKFKEGIEVNKEWSMIKTEDLQKLAEAEAKRKADLEKIGRWINKPKNTFGITDKKGLGGAVLRRDILDFISKLKKE